MNPRPERTHSKTQDIRKRVKPYMSLNESILRIMGAWPDQNTKTRNVPNLRLIVAAIMYIIAGISCINQIRLTNDISTLAECLSLLGVFVVMGHKLLALYRHRSRLSKLIIMTRVPLELLGENSETVNHISALDNMQFVYSIGIFLSTAVTASFFVLRPPIHVLLNRGKHSNDSDAQLPDDDPLLPLKMVVPIPKGYEEKFWVYVSLYTYHSLLSFYHILGFPGVDGFYAGLVLHAAARLHLLRMAFGRLRGDANELTEGNARKKDCPIVHPLWMEDQTAEQVQVEVGEEVRLQRMLSHRVREHQEILSYINQVEEVVNSLMMSQFFMSSSVIPCTAYQVVNFPGDIVNVTINMAFLLGALLQLGAYCYFGDYVKQESDAVGESMYFGDWVGAGRAHASSLRIVIMRCQAPTRFTIGRFSELSLATYDSILRGCYTYFALLNDISY